MSKRQYDVVIYGATGFTGALCVEYFRDHAPKELKWAVAGRQKSKLELVLKDLNTPTIPILVADSSDPASLAEMCKNTTVVLTTVGPFAKYGYPLVAACVRAGTHYCDITGEPQFVSRVIDTLHDDAVKNNSLIVSCCGYDSVPSDLGNMMMLRAAAAEFPGVPVTRVTGYHNAKGGPSGGTIHTVFNLVETATKETIKIMTNPFALTPTKQGSGVSSPLDAPVVYYSRTLGKFNSPFVMAGINVKVVNRSNALRNSKTQYTERMGPMGLLMAMVTTFGFSIMMLTVAIAPLRWLAKKVAPSPGEGPSKNVRETGWFKSIFVCHLANGRTIKGMVQSRHGDPGYKETSKMLSEAAICMALQGSILPHKGGVLTPSIALGETYLKRLAAAGFEFETKVL
eukprot:PhF_6_TR536/c0_g1_i1/m.400